MKTQTRTPTLIVKEGIHGRGVFATKPIQKNTIIFKMRGPVIDSPTQTSVQVGQDQHVEDAIAGLINHSCHPSARIDRQAQSFVSIRDIEPGDEITFDYTLNEDSMAVPFICECCGRQIRGIPSGL